MRLVAREKAYRAICMAPTSAIENMAPHTAYCGVTNSVSNNSGINFTHAEPREAELTSLPSRRDLRADRKEEFETKLYVKLPVNSVVVQSFS